MTESAWIPLAVETREHDMYHGPCKCGAWHYPTDQNRPRPCSDICVHAHDKHTSATCRTRGCYLVWLWDQKQSSGKGVMNGLALCSGIGGIELGLRIATEGRYRTVCHVEWESYAAATLVARMEDAALDQAPIWDDL